MVEFWRSNVKFVNLVPLRNLLYTGLQSSLSNSMISILCSPLATVIRNGFGVIGFYNFLIVRYFVFPSLSLTNIPHKSFVALHYSLFLTVFRGFDRQSYILATTFFLVVYWVMWYFLFEYQLRIHLNWVHFLNFLLV
jgi:hypothetical protein